VNVGVRDSTYVLDGLLYHESDLRIEEHYTDTAGFTDHVFALMHLLGFRFAPRIRDLGDTKLYIPKGDAAYDALKPMIGGTLNIKHVRAHWDEILRLATSIKQGTVTASLMLRKLGSYPRQNGLAVAARAGAHRAHAVHPGLAAKRRAAPPRACRAEQGRGAQRAGRAVFFNRLGEIRDRSFEQQRYRASGLNLVTAAIVLWNTVYLERAQRAAWHGMPSMTAVAVPVAAGLGTHQPDRRLPLAQQRQDRRGQVQAAATAATGLACFIFRFLRRPQNG
jgi:TnpA family transposase